MIRDNFIEEIKNVLDASLDCIKILNIKGEVLYINKGGLIEHGFKDRKETKNWNYLNTIKEKYQLKIKSALKKSVKGKVSVITIQHIMKGVKGASNRKWCKMTFSLVTNLKKEPYILLISRDVSKEKYLEGKLKEKLEKLEKVNNILINRENKMFQLKKELQKYKQNDQ
ncbi:MAG: hypothetical protein CO137_00335 [Candidatus Magasanikbacteria bacterium CG_4_9_14_3_um_filter_32_9]|uniref:PAS domain-containing protein n=1 Tax=Candidatus Magasanikbacteria bacterium CG_4_9_14_3_um_filter_32_9 TaxID=1974644 RepID=A0A2M7Z7Q6_9BACT|nr:MAG: hypothetical protein CO137_00335 [Candidatus Magasanikbacteria bacterium CG_4_9_14_3_um_filter_32_9]